LIDGLSVTAAFVYSSKKIKRIAGQGKHQMSYKCLPLPICLKVLSLSDLQPWDCRITV